MDEEDDYRIYDRGRFEEIQKWAGYRGDYKYEPYYLKSGFSQKAYFWDEPSKEWRLLRAGDYLFKRTDGSVFMESPHKKAGYHG